MLMQIMKHVVVAITGLAALSGANAAREDEPLSSTPSAESYVEQMSSPRREQKFARWKDRICPIITGVDADQASEIKDRIAKVAQTVGIRTIPKCDTHLLIIFSNDPDAAINSLLDRYRIALRGDGYDRLRRFEHSNAPVRWVSLTDPCGQRGCQLMNSHITVSEHPELRTMVIVVDGQQLKDVRLPQLSDYLAMVTLANPPIDAHPPSDSIMNSLDGVGPKRLTATDRAFLRGLYDTREFASAMEQRNAVTNALKEADAASHP